MCYSCLVRFPSVQFVAMAFFALGFALVSCGASGVLALALDGRPGWSVCGQDMCACVPVSLPAEDPACPLCVLSEDPATPGVCALGERDEPVRRVPAWRDEMGAADHAARALGSALYLSLVVALRADATPGASSGRVLACTRDPDPGSACLGVPTPPPRA